MHILVLIVPENTEFEFTARPIVKAREREPEAIETTGEESAPDSLPPSKAEAA